MNVLGKVNRRQFLDTAWAGVAASSGRPNFVSRSDGSSAQEPNFLAPKGTAALKAIKIAIAQIPISMGNKKANEKTILAAIESAAREKCDVVVPECSLTGWLSSAARNYAEPVPGTFSDSLGKLARKRQLAIVAGMEEREGPRSITPRFSSIKVERQY